MSTPVPAPEQTGAAQASRPGVTLIIYDGACPFCTQLVKLLRLRHAVGDVQLHDARQGGAVVDAVRAAGLDLSQGMVLAYRGHHYHGAHAMHMLALLSSGSSAANRLFARLFSSRRFCRYSYPALRAGRNLLLWLRGVAELDRNIV